MAYVVDDKIICPECDLKLSKKGEHIQISEDDRSDNQVICKTCGTIGPRKRITKGSFLVELVLWFVIPLLCGLFLTPAGLLIAVLGPIYTTWRWVTSYKGCSVCSGWDVIPAGTPTAKRMQAEQYATSQKGCLEKKESEPNTPVDNRRDITVELEKLWQLKQKNILTIEEFETQKAKLLSS